MDMSLRKSGQNTPEGFIEVKNNLIDACLKVKEATVAARLAVARSKWAQVCKDMPTPEIDENVAPNGTQPSV